MAMRPPGTGTPRPEAVAAGRYAYLVARLRNRQITMEEATELFGLMDETIRMLRTANLRMPPPAAPAAATPPPRQAAPTPGAGVGADDLLTAGVLMIGAGAGIAAALRRRSAEGPAQPDPTVTTPAARSSSGP